MNDTRAQRAFQNFTKALGNLERTLTLPEDNEDYRNSTLLSFVLAYEQFWKMLRWALKEYIALDPKGPKPTIQDAYSQGWLGDDDTAWLDMADDRNLISHTYNEAQALDIYTRVKQHHAPNMRSVHGLLAGQYPDLDQ